MSFGLYITGLIVAMFGAVLNLPNSKHDSPWPCLLFMLAAACLAFLAVAEISLQNAAR